MYKGGEATAIFENNSYLSKAGNSAGAPLMIREVYNFFRSDLVFIAPNGTTIQLNWFEKDEIVKQVEGILSAVDTGFQR
ncbi:MAG: hypothetical protein R3E08_08105 [Thiotrichaceae bacterium]